MGCTDPLRRGVSAPHQCPLGVGSKLPLPLCADVRLHIPMTHNGDSPSIRLAEQQVSPHTHGLTDISGVPVTIDLGGKSAWGYDHPPNKNEISRRLALQTVHAAFGVQGRMGYSTSDIDDSSTALLVNLRIH